MTSFLVQPARRPLAGSVRVPGDKSIGHRAVLCGALGDGVTTVRGLSGGEDNARTLDAVEALGVAVDRAADAVRVHGVGPDGLRAPSGPIDCGNSGTCMRLLAGLLAGQPFSSALAGDRSLSSRPMRRIVDPLSQMGAAITGAEGARAGEVYPPLAIAGRGERDALAAVDYAMPIASAQVKSAIIFAALYAGGRSRVVEPGASRDHTERMLAHLGAPVRSLPGRVVEIDPAAWDRRLRASEIDVPGDPSSAAFLLAAALIAGAREVRIARVCANPTRTGFLDVLERMGARVERREERAPGAEPTAELVIDQTAASALHGVEVGGDLTVRSIDEIPILAVVAARARGVTEFRDAAELRVKESDRIATTVEMLRRFGVDVAEQQHGFVVRGTDQPLRAAHIDAAGDHRIAMAAAVAALVAEGAVRIDDVDNVATSFPGFVDAMTSLGVDIGVG